ncbi:MAG TPA: SDR family NAD(P)-dependent oxidoreductase [Candidatus Acidoferrales bacterium]|jgi:NAD(P)-dependent dehydrogenase (short-subunit alcohol dehydrogenase family)|nr:SDR family NAD(P)-dependent oxidoreductase [Candidatus Acidoferrales bacterium]
MSDKKPAILTGASQGIGVGLVEAFLKEGYNIIATSRDVSRSFTTSPNLVLIDGDIGKPGIATKCIEGAMRHFGTIDVLVNNPGNFRKKPLTDFSTEDFNALVPTNLPRMPLHHAARSATDAETEIGRRCDHLCVARRSASRRHTSLSFDDEEREAWIL